MINFPIIEVLGNIYLSLWNLRFVAFENAFGLKIEYISLHRLLTVTLVCLSFI